jgi:hypothetical protein
MTPKTEIVCAAANGRISFSIVGLQRRKIEKAQKNWRAKFVSFEKRKNSERISDFSGYET